MPKTVPAMFKLRADREDRAAPTESPTSINYCKYNLFIKPYMKPFSLLLFLSLYIHTHAHTHTRTHAHTHTRTHAHTHTHLALWNLRQNSPILEELRDSTDLMMAITPRIKQQHTALNMENPK